MSVRPIIFSGPMVRAILKGRKSQTRRLIDLPEEFDNAGDCVGLIDMQTGKYIHPGYEVGDRLWVREGFGVPCEYIDCKPSELPANSGIIEYAEYIDQHGSRETAKVWPSIFMPRWASRLTLTVTDVRVERLQDISQDDGYAEGIPSDYLESIHGPGGFRDLWDSLNAKRAPWESNPWVVAITFAHELGNIDQERAKQ